MYKNICNTRLNSNLVIVFFFNLAKSLIFRKDIALLLGKEKQLYLFAKTCFIRHRVVLNAVFIYTFNKIFVDICVFSKRKKKINYWKLIRN